MMQGVGSGVSTFGEYSNLPENLHAAVSAGINIIEIKSERPIFFGRQINGPFNVTAIEEFNTLLGKNNYIVNWLTGERAAIRFDVPKRGGIARAYMPDDIFWHNRIMICDNTDLQRVTAYHTREGMFPGALILEEVNILYRAITVPGVEFTVYNARGIPIGSFPTEALALQDIKDNGYRNHEVRKREIRIKSPAVMDMMRRWRTEHRSKYGWTDCPEFKTLQQQIKQQIKDQRQAAPVAGVQLDQKSINAAVISAIRSMPVAERKKLLEATTSDQVEENVFTGKAPELLTTGQLKELAKKHGVKYSGASTRKSIIKNLRAKGVEIADEQAADIKAAADSAPEAGSDVIPEEEVVR